MLFLKYLLVPDGTVNHVIRVPSSVYDFFWGGRPAIRKLVKNIGRHLRSVSEVKGCGCEEVEAEHEGGDRVEGAAKVVDVFHLCHRLHVQALAATKQQ